MENERLYVSRKHSRRLSARRDKRPCYRVLTIEGSFSQFSRQKRGKTASDAAVGVHTLKCEIPFGDMMEW